MDGQREREGGRSQLSLTLVPERLASLSHIYGTDLEPLQRPTSHAHARARTRTDTRTHAHSVSQSERGNKCRCLGRRRRSRKFVLLATTAHSVSQPIRRLLLEEDEEEETAAARRPPPPAQ